MAYLSKQQVKDIITNAPKGTIPEDIVQALVQEGHQLEGFNEQQSLGSKVLETGKDLGVGIVKGLGRTAVDMYKTAGALNDINPISNLVKSQVEKTSIGSQMLQKGNEINNKIIDTADKTLEPKNTAEKIGGYLETAGEILIPTSLVAKGVAKATELPRAISTAKKALLLGEKELKNISTGKFKKIFNIEKSELENVGGIIKSEVKKMPEKVNQLAEEFKDVLQGKPTENLNNAKQLGKEYWNKTLDLFEGENKIMNEKTIRSYLKQKIEENMSFDSPFQKKEIVDKTIEPFMKQIKEGSLKGIEEARGKLSVISRDTSGKLKMSTDLLNKAVKDIVRENLPEAKQIAYDAYKQKMAKLFDVRELLKAKNIASGTSLLKKAGKIIVGGGLAAGAYQGIKNMIK